MKRKATPGHIVVSKVWPGHPDWEPEEPQPFNRGIGLCNGGMPHCTLNGPCPYCMKPDAERQ